MLNINIDELAVINLGKDLEIFTLKKQVQQTLKQMQEFQRELEKYESQKEEESKP